MTVEIICPLYNAEAYFLNLHNSFLKQKDVNIKKITYILTESSDKTEVLLNEKDIPFDKVAKRDFSHSLIREKAAMNSTADIVVFVTQDIIIESNVWLKNLVSPIIKKICDATYSRQISKFNNIEKYTRERNYPEKSFVVDNQDIKKKGLRTFFFSDASGAILRKTFVELNGYDGKNLPISEDMYFAYKLIINGKKIGYVSNSVVYHSHNFTLKELYERYKLTGLFFKQNDYLDQYGTNSSGMELAKYILKRIIQEKEYKNLIRYPFDMMARFIGMKVGKR